MQDINVLLTQSKTTPFNEVIKFNTQSNTLKNGNTKGHAFADVLFSDQMEAENNKAIEKRLNDQSRGNLPVATEPRKSNSVGGQYDLKANESSDDNGDYGQEGYQDIDDHDSDRFVSQEGASDIVAEIKDKVNVETDENSTATVDPDNESEEKTIQEDSDVNSNKDVSHNESATDSRDGKSIETVGIEGEEDEQNRHIKSDIISNFKEVFAGIEERLVDAESNGSKSEIITKLKDVFTGIEERLVDAESNGSKSEIITKLKDVFTGIEERLVDAESNSSKAEIITKLKEVFAGIEERLVDAESNGSKSEVITKLEGVFASIEESMNAVKGVEEVEAVKSEIITKLKDVFTGIEERLVDAESNSSKAEIITKLKEVFAGIEERLVDAESNGSKSEVITKLEGVFASIEESMNAVKGVEEVEAVKAEIITKLKDVFTGIEERLVDAESNGSKSEVITKLEGVFASIEESTNAVKGVEKVEAVKSEVITKLEGVFAAIDENEGDIVVKRKGLFFKGEEVRNKNEELSALSEKNLNGSSIFGKNDKNVKSGEVDTDNNLLNDIVERLDENKNEKIIIKDKNTGKRDTVNGTASNDLNDAKVSGKTKQSTDSSSKSKGDSSATLENEAGIESGVTKDGNRVETSNSDRDIRVEQRVTAQGTKSDLSEQNQNKSKFANQMKNGQSDNGNAQRTDSDQQIIGEKTQSVFRAETAGQVDKIPTSTQTIPRSQLGETIVRNAKQFQKGGNSEVHITIKKPELGTVKLTFVENSKGKLEVTLVAERFETSELIKQGSAEIRQLLQQEGIDLSKFDVFDQESRNKKYFAQGNGFNKGSRKDDLAEDDGLDKDEEGVAESHDPVASKIDSVNSNSNEQVNVFV